MRLCLKKSFILFFLTAFFIVTLGGCARYALIRDRSGSSLLFEQEKEKDVIIGVKKFVDDRPREEKKGLTRRTRKILSFASSDKDFKEKIDEAITRRIEDELEKGKFYIKRLTDDGVFGEKDYILEGEVKHFQVVMRLPNTTFVPYLGTASTIIAKDEFNIAVSIKATLKDAETDEVLFSEVFDASVDSDLPTGLLYLARFKRGIGHRFKLIDKALDNVLERIVRRVNVAVCERG